MVALGCARHVMQAVQKTSKHELYENNMFFRPYVQNDHNECHTCHCGYDMVRSQHDSKHFEIGIVSNLVT